MIRDPLVVEELCGEHTAVHIHYPAENVPGLRQSFERRGGFVADIALPAAASTPEALAEHFSRQLLFPEMTTNWNAVNDWATDLDFIGNPIGYVVIVRGLEVLAQQRLEDRTLPIKLWARGPRGFQFQEQAFHAVLVGDDPPGVDIADLFRARVPIERISPEMLANIGYGSDRIPVYDWRTDPPTLLIE